MSCHLRLQVKTSLFVNLHPAFELDITRTQLAAEIQNQTIQILRLCQTQTGQPQQRSLLLENTELVAVRARNNITILISASLTHNPNGRPLLGNRPFRSFQFTVLGSSLMAENSVIFCYGPNLLPIMMGCNEKGIDLYSFCIPLVYVCM
jgi:hypothetical protein